MKNIGRNIVVLLLFALQACNFNEPCGVCFSPPKFFYFELVDKNTGENLFTNGTLKSADLEVLDLANNASVEYEFISEDSVNILNIFSIGWHSEIVTYAITIADSTVFELYVNAERLSEDCCSFTRYHEIRIDETEYEHSLESDIYTIIVDY